MALDSCGITGIDHTLVGVRDLETARATWTRLGFTVTPRGRHIGWGTGNYCVMLAEGYVELLGIVDPSQFSNNLDKLLEKREGLLGLAFATPDANACRDALEAAGLKPDGPKQLKRDLELPTGTVTPEFRLVFLPPESTPEVSAFVTHHLTPELVRQTGPIDSILTHVDLDGLYAAAKWIMGGEQPYKGADDDARAVDTRVGTPGPIANRIDRALRAKFRDDQLKRAVVQFLVGGMKSGVHDDVIGEAATEFDRKDAVTRDLARKFTVRGRVAVVDTQGLAGQFDKTDLLLAGQERAPVSIVRDSGMLTIAAAFDSGWDFVALFELGGGMPTRVTIPEQKLDGVIAKINEAPEPTPR